MFSVGLLLVAVVIVICVLANKLSSRIGMPVLLAFIILGMIFGSDGILKIPFSNYSFAEQICSVALIFIMFYGGFGTKLSEAKPVAVKALLLSSVGVILTAALTAVFCFFVLKISILESMLIGALLSSTDAASVFSILRSKSLNLKYNTASMLEVESGSNDPFAYMLTVIVLSAMKGDLGVGSMILSIAAQLVFGIVLGFLIAYGAVWFMKHFDFTTSGFDAAFVLGAAILSYSLPMLIGGNGYLSAYIVGIILGNQNIHNKKSLVHFFDGITGLMQMLIFFLLGLLSFPSKILTVLVPSILIAVFLTFIARPVAVGAVLAPFRTKLSQYFVISWAGLRGAASIVFAIMATVGGVVMENDVFHIAFCVVLFSITLQGSLLPFIAKKTNMIDKTGTVLKTFNDYSDETEINFIRLSIDEGNRWIDRKVKDISLPPQMLFAAVFRGDETIIPNGDTIINEGDTIVLGAPSHSCIGELHFREISVNDRKQWRGKSVAEIDFPEGYLVIMVKRGNDVVIPTGSTIVDKNDELVLVSK